MPRKREYNKKVRRLSIIEAARGLFLEKNYSLITVDEIASLAGLSKKTLYTYFSSKLSLYIEMFEEYLQQLHSELAKVRKQSLPADESFLVSFDTLYQFTKKNRKFMRLFWQVSSKDFNGSIPDELISRIHLWNKAMLDDALEGVISLQKQGYFLGFNPNLLVHLISSMNKGIFVHVNKENILEVKDIDADNLYNEFVKLLTAGLNLQVKKT